MNPHEILEQSFKEQFGNTWESELGYFQYRNEDFYNAAIKAIEKASTLYNRPKKVYTVHSDGIIYGCFYNKDQAKKHTGERSNLSVKKLKVI